MPESDPNPPPRTFPKFSELPNEIKLQIWQHAIPDPRSIRGAICLILDFTLGKPRAILPSIQELKESYVTLHDPDLEGADGELENTFRRWDMYEYEEHFMWRSDDDTMAESRQPVLTLLHTCRTSRLATMERYRLDIGSIIEEENQPWWVPEEDMVLVPMGDCDEYHVSIHWMFRQRNQCLPVFKTLQHVAFVADRSLVAHILPSPGNKHPWQVDQWWLNNFPALESFTLLADPGSVLDHHDGTILLHEPLDVPVPYFRGTRPSRFLPEITDVFAKVMSEGKEAPLVEMFVTTRRRPKKSKR